MKRATYSENAAAVTQNHRATAASIRWDASGKTCGTCSFNHSGTCAAPGNVGLAADGNYLYTRPLRIWREDAAACGKHKGRVE